MNQTVWTFSKFFEAYLVNHSDFFDNKMTLLNSERSGWIMIETPKKSVGPDAGYINSLTGQIEKPKNFDEIYIEIYLKKDFLLKFRSCESQHGELFDKIFSLNCQ